MIPCAFGNDGTALKPAIEFYSRLKENVGLTIHVDLRYVLKTPFPSPDFLKENIVTEALVSFLTLLSYFCSLSVAVDYTPQAGKESPYMPEHFHELIKTVQVCETCQKKRLVHVILPPFTNPYVAASVKNATCLKMSLTNANHWDRSVTCPDCVSAIIAKKEIQYVFRRAVLVVCSDCESGNKRK